MNRMKRTDILLLNNNTNNTNLIAETIIQYLRLMMVSRGIFSRLEVI
jgi:hypothetical protein